MNEYVEGIITSITKNGIKKNYRIRWSSNKGEGERYFVTAQRTRITERGWVDGELVYKSKGFHSNARARDVATMWSENPVHFLINNHDGL